MQIYNFGVEFQNCSCLIQKSENPERNFIHIPVFNIISNNESIQSYFAQNPPGQNLFFASTVQTEYSYILFIPINKNKKNCLL